MLRSPEKRTLLVRRAPSGPWRGILQAGTLRIPCALGRTGTTIRKRESDGATPVAAMALLFAYRRRGRLAAFRSSLPVRLTRGDDGWCDAPRHPAYNRPVRLPHAASAEWMARDDRLYDLVVVLDWNVRRRVRGLGSAIFLHIAADASLPPTAGCVAVTPRDMARLAPLLRRGTRLVVRR